jgi:hypothetical protein
MELGIFAVDGDWTIDSPDGAPEISFPFEGDSILSLADVVRNVRELPNPPLEFDYQTFELGNRMNLQPWRPNQYAFVINQKFKVAAEFYRPMNLNTRYDPEWALPWQGQLASGYDLPVLSEAILVNEGNAKDCGGGIIEIERRFATIPATRNEAEQYCIKRVSFGIQGVEYPRAPMAVMTRLQHDFFVYDDLDILQDLPLFTDPNHAGIRLNAETGFAPKGIIIEAFKVYGATTNVEVDVVFDADATYSADSSITYASTPSLTQYKSWMKNGGGTSNHLAAEIAIEASTIQRYMGNILRRTTRFAEVQ